MGVLAKCSDCNERFWRAIEKGEFTRWVQCMACVCRLTLSLCLAPRIL